jgi:hypothetical protein
MEIPVQIISVDHINAEAFVVYFSDGSTLTLTAKALLIIFPLDRDAEHLRHGAWVN